MKRIDLPDYETLTRLVDKYVAENDTSSTLYYQEARELIAIGIAYANEQLEAASAQHIDMGHVISLLDDIRSASQYPKTDGKLDYIERTARMAQEELLKYQPVPQNESWQPMPGQKCAFWSGADEYTLAGIFELGKFDDIDEEQYVYSMTAKRAYDHCAAIESLDEIGREPSYFINRPGGKCTVRKDKTE